ncbi:hypothetical protein DFP72DRAFT_780197, partial [Ephemerocybe angulata]
MYESYSKNESILDKSKETKPGNGARQMIMKVVNSLSSKMEIGAPMAALYLLKNPDHYTSHQFVPFYWKNYVSYVQGQWKAMMDLAEPAEDDEGMGPEDDAEPGDEEQGVPHDDIFPPDHSGTQETVRISRSNGRYMAKSNTDDYRYRPAQMEHISLYEWVQCSMKHPLRASHNPRQDLRWVRFLEDHPQFESQAVALDPDRRTRFVPHFIGPSLPRRDAGDKEEYCCAMLTLFKPWRTGIDLKSADFTWEETFNQFNFTARQKELMDNFNMRYECYDARDDFGTLIKAAGGAIGGGNEGDEDEDDEEDVYADNGENDEDDDSAFIERGRQMENLQRGNIAMNAALNQAGWKNEGKPTGQPLSLPCIAIDSALRAAAWNNIIKVEKLRAWRRKIGLMGSGKEDEVSDPATPFEGGKVKNDAYVVPGSYISKDFKPRQEKWSDVMTRVIKEFKLNEGQEKAFRIVANHSCCIVSEQLLMHLGGMGGTGKSTVIRALCKFFEERKESYRFVLLGPTGTSAALIGGSTYHSFLGINTTKTAGGSTAIVEEVRE